MHRHLLQSTLLAFVIFISGCGQDTTSLTGPAAIGEAVEQSSGATALIGAAGGSMETLGSRVVVPPGALPGVVLLSLSTEFDAGVTHCTLGPSALQFAADVELWIALPTSASPGDAFVVERIEESSGTWTRVESSRSVGGVIVKVGSSSQFRVSRVELT